MILEALYRLAEQEELVGDPDYEMKPVAWLIRVDDGGRLLGLEATRAPVGAAAGARRKKTILEPKHIRVPRQPIRTSGDRAFFLCDKAEYTLGIEPPAEGKKRRAPEKVAARFKLFRDQVQACLVATGDPGVKAVHDFLELVAAGRETVRLPPDCAANDLFAFVYAPDIDRPVHERPAVRQYWAAARRASADPDGSSGMRCLVTGEPVTDLVNVPLLKKVPGGTPSGASLVSFNAPAFESHGWRGNENAPISRAAAEAVATALNRLLHPGYPDPHPDRLGQPMARRSLRIAPDTVVCYWASGLDATPLLDAFAALLNPDDPAQVGDLYRSLWRGRRIQLPTPARFYALTISGAQGRAIVRDWFEASVAEVADNLAQYFHDIDVARLTPAPRDRPLPPQFPLESLLSALAPPGRDEGVPGWLAAQMVHAALQGGIFPIALLQKAVERARAEAGGDEWIDLARRDARAAIIKAVLRRNFSHQELRPTMDPTNTQPGYRLGRLLAVLERLQQEALGKDVNATVVDRFFGAASAAPQAVFPRLLKNARHHVSKARDDARSAGLAIWLDRQIDEILAPLAITEHRQGLPYTGFPTYLSLEQQALFMLGYHHQRHWLRLSKEEREKLLDDAAPA